MARGFDASFEVVEVAGVIALESESIEPDAGVMADRQRVMVALVPTFEEHPVVGLLDQLHAEDLRVVRSGQLEIGHGDVDMAQTKDSHRINVRV